MTLKNTEIDVMQRELAILMTNSVELQNKMYDIFVNPSPGMVDLRVWTDRGFETISIPNLAKSRRPVITGNGTPILAVEGSVGTIYINEQNKDVYINTGEGADSETGLTSSGWVKLATVNDIDNHNNSAEAHYNVLATINGDKDTPFHVADTDSTSDSSLAVNVGSMNAFLGTISNLNTAEKGKLVEAINEILFTAEKEVAAVVSTNVTSRTIGTQKPRVFRVVKNDNNEFSIRVDTNLEELTAIKVDGTKYFCSNMRDVLPVKVSGKTAVFLKDLDKSVPTFECIPDGNYYIGESRPYIMKGGDVWLDTGCRPYKMYQAVKSFEGSFEDAEVDYIYLGTVEEV